MARDWESVFTTWAKPPSDTEQEKADNAARMIREAVRADNKLAALAVDVYPSGSYRNKTNVRLDSDVDVAVVFKGAVYYEFDTDKPTREMLGVRTAEYGLTHFRDDVERALVRAFGRNGVTAGDKAFDVHENTYRLDADVAVFLEHRRYTGRQDSEGRWHHFVGVEMRPRSDPAKRIINWHQQHYDSGVKRNDATQRRYKRMARILKRLRNEMVESGDASQQAIAKKMPSFLLECLAFSAGDECYNCDGTFYADVKAVIRDLWNRTKPEREQDYSKLVEVSGMKWLFRPTQPWSAEQAHEFLLRSWQYVGFA